MITIISPTRIEVDGRDAGLPLDYFLANVDKRAEVKAAFIAWHASHVIAQQARDAELAAAKEQYDADIATLGTKDEAVAIRKAQERKAKLEQLAALQAELRQDEHTELEPVDVKP